MSERNVAETNIDLTDELLVAYVDDELEPAEREMVSSVLASNQTLSHRAEEMRLARDLLREAFPLRPDASIPPAIEAAADRLAEACSRRASAQVESSFRWRWKYAIAAAVVLCLTASATYLAWRGGRESSRQPVTALMRISRDTPLHRVLESTPGAEAVNVLEEDAVVRAVLTFRAKDGRFCREFEILADSGAATGIACREHGEWRTEVLRSAAAAQIGGDRYRPAGESDEPAVAQVAEHLIQGDPLSAEEEARVLASGWRTSASP